jgi:UDP-glucose 4-epimerase
MILITGGAGYIGSVVAEKLCGQGVIIVDDLRFGNIGATKNNCDHWYNADICDIDNIHSIFYDHTIDLVIHLAASANVPESIFNPQEYYENNVVGTLNILRCMKDAGVKNIIFASTASVYDDMGNYLNEDSPIKPNNPYGRSKLMCEQIIKDFSMAYGMRYNIFRFFCAAGATEQHGESRRHETHLIPKILDVALGKQDKLIVYGDKHATPDGTCIRDFVHVEDIAEAVLLSPLDNKAYNLGCGWPYSVLNIIKEAGECLNVKIPYEIKDARDGDIDFLVANTDMAKKELGWIPMHDLQDIIKSAYQWRKNPRY